MPFKSAWQNESLLPPRDQILTALRRANATDNSYDPRPLHAIIAALPGADLDILSAIESRKNRLLGYEWQVAAGVPPSAEVAPDIERQRAAEIAGRFKSCGLSNELGTLFNARLSGVVGIELNWSTAERGAHVVESYTVVDPIDLRRHKTALRGYARYAYNGTGNDDYVIAPYDVRERVILATYNPLRGLRSEFDGGLLRTLIYLTVLKHYNWYDWAKVGEKYGDPAVVAKYPRALGQRKNKEGKTEAEVVLEWISAIATESGAAIPDDIKLEVLDLVTKGASADMFEKFIDKVTSKQERLIQGQDVVNIAASKQTQGGSYAKAVEANETSQDYTWSDLIWLQDVVTQQYVVTDYLLNYGTPSTLIYPSFKFQTDEIEDNRSNAAIVQLLTSSGYTLDEEEVRQKTGFTVRQSIVNPTLPEVM